MAEPIDHICDVDSGGPLGILDGVQNPTCEGAVLRVKIGRPRICLDVSGG